MDYLSLQVSNLARARDFYCRVLGITAAPSSPPGVQVLRTRPVPMALRADLPPRTGTAGLGVALWLDCEDVDALHERVMQHGGQVELAPTDGPFGRMFTVADPDGYRLTLHRMKR
nr:VOC family protein [Saccharopolyspora sp. HNM0983]